MEKVNKRSQQTKILQHLIEFGPITAIGITRIYNIGSPRKRVSELCRSGRAQELGYEIHKDWIDGHKCILYSAHKIGGDQDAV